MPDLLTALLCLKKKPCLAQTQPSSPRLIQGKTVLPCKPRQRRDQSKRCRSMKVPGSPTQIADAPQPVRIPRLSQGGVLGDAPSHRPRPIGRQRAAKPKAKSATASPAPTSRRRLLLPALPKPSAAHALLPKKAGALLEKRTPASGKCLVRRETEAVPSTGVRHGSKAAVTDPALASGRVPRRDRAGTAEWDSFHRRSRGHRDPVGHAERLLLTLLHILIRMTKIR